MVVVAQLVRAPGCGPGGRGFDPHQSPHKAKAPREGCFCFMGNRCRGSNRGGAEKQPGGLFRPPATKRGLRPRANRPHQSLHFREGCFCFMGNRCRGSNRGGAEKQPGGLFRPPATKRGLRPCANRPHQSLHFREGGFCFMGKSVQGVEQRRYCSRKFQNSFFCFLRCIFVCLSL